MIGKWNALQKDSLVQKNQFRKLEFVKATKTSLVLNQNQVTVSTATGVQRGDEIGKGNSEKTKKSLFDERIADDYLQWKKVAKVGPGFFNDGNTCYLNSTLQCLVHTPALAQILLHEPKLVMKSLVDAKAAAESQFERKNGQSMRPILHHFHSLVGDVWNSSSGRAIAPRSMISTIKRVGRQFKPMRQEDAHEYLRQLLDTMHEEILKANGFKTSDGKIAETTMFSRVFGGYLCNTLTCSKCNFASRTFNHFQDLSLDINQGIKSVSDAIATFTKPEYLTAGNEWKCEKCKQKVKAKKQMTFSQLPNVLVIQLKRFSFGNMFAKVTKPIQFSETMHLSEDNEANRSGEQRKTKYELYGVIVHHGHTTHSGHYIAYVKAPNGQWYEMNDSHVSAVSVKTVLACQAYILFYTRSGSGSKHGAKSTDEVAAPTLTPAVLVRTAANGQSTTEQLMMGDIAETTTQESGSSEGSSPRSTPQGEEDLGEMMVDEDRARKSKLLSQKRPREEETSESDSSSESDSNCGSRADTTDKSSAAEDDDSEDDDESYEEGSSVSDSSSDEDYEGSSESDDADTEIEEDEADICRSYDGVKPFPFVGMRRFGRWRCRKLPPIRKYIQMKAFADKMWLENEKLRQKEAGKSTENAKIENPVSTVTAKAASVPSVESEKKKQKVEHVSIKPVPVVVDTKPALVKSVILPTAAAPSAVPVVPSSTSMAKPVLLSASATASTAPNHGLTVVKERAAPVATAAPAKVAPAQAAAPAAIASATTASVAVTKTAAPAQIAAVVPQVDVVKQLMQQGIRGRDAGGEGVWETVSASQVAAADALNKKQRRERQKVLKARKPDEWNAMLDSGKVKKVKVANDEDFTSQRRDASGKIINPFQELAMRNAKN